MTGRLSDLEGMEDQTSLVVARQVKKSYGSAPVLTDVSFEIFPGVTGLLGPNGSGKTTMLGMVLGLHHRNGGQLTVFGSDPWNAGLRVREAIGYAPEHHLLPPDMQAAEFVQHVAELHGLPRSEAIGRASDAMHLVGLGEERFRRMGSMSTGQRQRVKVAQAIAHSPKLVILDEPTDGLDPNQREAMLRLITELSTDWGINILLSSHLSGEVDSVCDAVVIIGDGITKASGTIGHLKNQVDDAIEARLEGDHQQLQALANQLQQDPRVGSVEVDGRDLVATYTDKAVFDIFRDACCANGVGIYSLRRKRLSLEDVFIGSMQ